MAALVARLGALELENNELRQAYSQRESMFHQTCIQYRQEASVVADQYQAASAPNNAQANARAAQAERHATQTREALVQANERVVQTTAQSEQERLATEQKQ